MSDDGAPTPPSSPSSTEWAMAERDRLRAAVARLPQPGFAVVDGAHWDDLPSELARRGLEKRSLFLGAGKEAEAAGPWLVALGQRGNATDEILALVGEKPAAVFWACLPGEQALWRHLRTLNQARVAQPAADEVVEAASGLEDSGLAALGSEMVLFRHWDPRVLSDVLPILDEGQYARVLGPAEEAVFLDPERLGGVGLRRLKRFPDLPLMPRGMLTLDAGQIAALDESVRERSQRKTAAYLRDVAPELAGHRQLGCWPVCEKWLRQVGGRDDDSCLPELRRLPLPS